MLEPAGEAASLRNSLLRLHEQVGLDSAVDSKWNKLSCYEMRVNSTASFSFKVRLNCGWEREVVNN